MRRESAVSCCVRPEPESGRAWQLGKRTVFKSFDRTRRGYLMTLLLLQTAVILLVTLACGWLARRVGQARVIGEIIGGILLGPSLFGRLLPHAFAALFPRPSLAPFEILSTTGLIIFMFIIGTETDLEELYRHRATALLTSSASILFPFLLASALANPLRVRFAPPGIGSLTFALFLGISMSITAFPVLARILEERHLLGTPIGTTAIFCAAVDDVVAWLLLAVTLALLGANGGPAALPLRLAGLVLYLFIMLALVRPLASRLVRKRGSSAMPLEILGLTLVGVFASAAATEAIGVHPLFGAFLAGVCLPRSRQWQISVRARLDSVVSAFLLPLFFALTGMRTRIDLLNNPTVWFWAGIVLFAAVAAKMGGAVLAARITGQSWSYALGLGVLLNTRGLVELVVLNIAYDVGAFSPTLFTMLVIIALATTISTTPLLGLLRIERAASMSCGEPAHSSS
jgi:Kef-type K+ transport system membrane component KefB